MSTPISDTYELVRATMGDFHSVHKRYTDDAIKSVVRTVLRLGEVPGYYLAGDNVSITPTLTEPKALGLLTYKVAKKLLLPAAASNAYDTRAIRERFGEQRLFLAALEGALYELESGEMFSTFNSFYAWINGLTGLSFCEHITAAPFSVAASGTAVTTQTLLEAGIDGTLRVDGPLRLRGDDGNYYNCVLLVINGVPTWQCTRE